MRGLATLVWLGAVACAAPTDHVVPDGNDAGVFRVVVMPDIQYVSLSYPDVLVAMNQWVVDHRDDQHIAFLIQEGDLVHNNTEAEWRNAREGFDILGDLVPYALTVGNHDMDAMGDTTLFNSHFHVSGFQDQDWFGGVYEDGKLDNAWYTFEAGGTSWIVLSLQWDTPEGAYPWANDVLEAHADHRALVVTHAYLGVDGERTRPGQMLYQRVIKHHDNISMVFNGHYLPGGGTRLKSTRPSGTSVWQLFFNFQDQAFGGRGMIRILTFDPAAGTVAVDTYSPWLDLHETGDDHAFVLDNMDLSPPL